MSTSQEAPASSPPPPHRPKAPAPVFGEDNAGCFVKAALGCFGLLMVALLAGGAGIWWVWNKTMIPADEARERAPQVLALTLPLDLVWTGGFEMEERVFFFAGDRALEEGDPDAVFLMLYQGPDEPGAWRRDKVHVDRRGEVEAVDSGTEAFDFRGESLEGRWSRFSDGRVDYDVVFRESGHTVALYLTGPGETLDAALFQQILDSAR